MNWYCMILTFFIYPFWICLPVSPFVLSFIDNIRNLTIIYKPNAFIYHICETSKPIDLQQIYWNYIPNTTTDIDCKNLSEDDSNCFEIYYGPSTSLLIIKEPDINIGKYTCLIKINSSDEILSDFLIDIKTPLINDNMINEDQLIKLYSEHELGKLAKHYNVPFIFDENDVTSYGKRIDIGGIYYTECRSIESSYPISFTWIHLRIGLDGSKIMRFIRSNGSRILVKNKKFSSTLLINSADFSHNGDYICIATNVLGQSYSSKRSLIISERIVLPRIHNNILNHSYFDLQQNYAKELICRADGFPIPIVVWMRAHDSIVVAQNLSHAVLNFDKQKHGIHDYVCQAKNRYGLSKLFIRVLKPNTRIKPKLTSIDIQNENVTFRCSILNQQSNQFDHFIIYYRRLNNIDENTIEDDDIIDLDLYKQILIDSSPSENSFTFQIKNLNPYTKYEFRIKAFINTIPTQYSNSIIVTTLEALPLKVENLHSYIFNRTSIVAHWTPINSTNGAKFHYLLYYTTSISNSFDQWAKVVVRKYSFHILSLLIPNNAQIFIRVATVNIIGSTLSDIYIINSTLLNVDFRFSLNRFHCTIDNKSILFQWIMDNRSRFYIKKYLLFYFDIKQNKNDDLIQMIPIPNNSIEIQQQYTQDLLKYQLNISSLNLNSKIDHILQFSLTLVDQYNNQFPMIDYPIYCIFSAKHLGKKIFLSY